jgi:hypothetical protein
MRILINEDIECTEDELNTFLSSFNLLEALKTICQMALSSELNFCSTDIAYRLVINANDQNYLLMTEADGEKALKMSYYLQSKSLNISSFHETFLKLANYQLDNDEALKYDIARTLCIYQMLWNKVYESKSIDIEKSIKQITNLNLQTLLVLNWSFGGQAIRNGFVISYSKDSLSSLSRENQEIFKVENQKDFLDYASITYSGIKTYNGKINPLKIFPLIDTQTTPTGLMSQVYMVPSTNNLIKRTTTNLYYTLSDKFKANIGKGNEFKTAFGFVFEAYVKSIFQSCLKSWGIEGEIIYDLKNKKKTVDIFLYKEDKLILVEVKQSSIYSEAKNNCTIIEIKKDLKQTLNKGVKQILNTEQLIKNQKIQALLKFKDVRYIQRLIVTYLPLKQANSSIKPLIKEEIVDYPDDHDFHIINIQELELFLSAQQVSESIFDLLHFKEINRPNQEFNEFIQDQFSDIKQYRIELLEKIANDFLNPILNCK